MQDDQLLVGTLGCEIYLIDVVTNDVIQLVQGHYDERCELWGLATHVSSHKFVTACDDGTVRLWDARTMRPLGLSKQADGTRVRTLTYKPDGSQVVIGTLEGRLVVLSSDLTEEIAEVTVCSCGIRALAFSPDGQTLAVGAADGRVHFLDSKFFSCHASTRPVSGSVRSLDFSADSTLIQVASFNFELKYFDRAMGKQIKSPSLLRDVKWATGSSSFGWATQGLWPIVTSAGGSASGPGLGPGASAGESERTSVVAGCAVSPDAKMILSGDNKARLRLHRYPASVENAKFREYRGHCGGITNVAFTFDGRFALSVSGLDKSIMQFEVKQPKTFSAAV
jgi:microtubule-associated protein-like 6